jgi:hypothetical protein
MGENKRSSKYLLFTYSDMLQYKMQNREFRTELTSHTLSVI